MRSFVKWVPTVSICGRECGWRYSWPVRRTDESGPFWSPKLTHGADKELLHCGGRHRNWAPEFGSCIVVAGTRIGHQNCPDEELLHCGGRHRNRHRHRNWHQELLHCGGRHRNWHQELLHCGGRHRNWHPGIWNLAPGIWHRNLRMGLTRNCCIVVAGTGMAPAPEWHPGMAPWWQAPEWAPE